jgi:soluble lytic murein transglycosylase
MRRLAKSTGSHHQHDALAGAKFLLQPSQRQRRWLRFVVLIAFAASLLQWLYRFQRERHYDPIIVAAAHQYAIDPALVKAVIWRESRFNSRARGRVGELGLMQVRKAAGQEWAAAEKKVAFTERHLVDPDTNIYAGSWYLAQLLRRYRAVDDPIPYALADYNAGRTHVLRWMQGVAKTNSAQFLAQMDFPGTRQYIESIRDRHAHYKPAFRRDAK